MKLVVDDESPGPIVWELSASLSVSVWPISVGSSFYYDSNGTFILTVPECRFAFSHLLLTISLFVKKIL